MSVHEGPNESTDPKMQTRRKPLNFDDLLFGSCVVFYFSKFDSALLVGSERLKPNTRGVGESGIGVRG